MTFSDMSSTNVLTVDVEDWFHILDSPAVPAVEQWAGPESRVVGNVNRLLELFAEHSVRATFCWLGWLAERNPEVVAQCQSAGHEVASHGYAHVLPYQVGQAAFREDIRKGKDILEAIIGEPVKGLRVAGFGIRDDIRWVFDEIRAAGYIYDASVFPAARAHGGIKDSPLEPHTLQTTSGLLGELPASMVDILGRKVCMFGGGYLRLFPIAAIRWGIERVHSGGRPLIVYVHPREIDPDHPRLPLSPVRRFKCYVNLKSTMPKMHWLCKTYRFQPMIELAEQLLRE